MIVDTGWMTTLALHDYEVWQGQDPLAVSLFWMQAGHCERCGDAALVMVPVSPTMDGGAVLPHLTTRARLEWERLAVAHACEAKGDG